MINRIRALFDRSSSQPISKDPTIAPQKIEEAERLERNANITEISSAQTIGSIQDFDKPLGQLLISQKIINQEQVQSILTNQAKLNLLSRSGEDIRNIDLSELDNKLKEKNISPELVDTEKQNIISKGNAGLKTTEPHVPVIGELALKSKMISDPQSFQLLLMMQGISRILTNTPPEDFLDINKKLYIDTETNSLVQSIQSTNHLFAIATSLGVNITDKEKNSITRRLFKKVLKNKDLDSKSRENLTRLMKKMKNSNSLRIFNPEKRLIKRSKKESINKIKRSESIINKDDWVNLVKTRAKTAIS
jgi:hypothetical protein